MNYKDIQLTAEEIAHFEKYEKSFGRKWVDGCLDLQKADNYCKRFLDAIVNTSRQAGNCYRVGYQEWKRKDGLPFDSDDLAALKRLDDGQSNIVYGEVGDMVVKRKWECDSGD